MLQYIAHSLVVSQGVLFETYFKILISPFDDIYQEGE